MTNNRRSAPRHQIQWQSQYRLSGIHAPWRDCRIVDASSTGVGLELIDATSARVNEAIIVETDDPAGLTSLEVTGQIRNVQPMSNGSLRVGVELVGVSHGARVALRQLAGLVRT